MTLTFDTAQPALTLAPLELLEALIDQPPEPPAVCEPMRDDDPVAEPLGCGWFDSSFELRQGLQVVELALPERWPLDPPPWARH